MSSDLDAKIAALCREHGLRRPRLVWDPRPEDVPVDYLRDLLRHWQTLREGDELPNLGRIDPLEFRSLLPHINLLEVLEGGRDFRYRVFSTTLAERLGVEFTGRLVSESGMFSAPFFALTYRACLERRVPLMTVHVPPAEISVAEWTRLILPLVDDDGAIARFITGVHPGPWRPPR